MAEQERIAVACALWADEYAELPNIRRGECANCKIAIVISRSSDLVLGSTSTFIVEAMCNRCTAEGIVNDLGLAIDS